MADGAVFVCALLQHLPNFVGHDRAGQRRVGRGQTFGDGDDVGAHAVMVRPEHRAETTEPRHDLIRDQQDVVFVQHRLNGLPVTCGRGHDAACAQHRFADESGDGVGAFAFDQRLKLGRAMGGELFFAHIQVGAAEVVGRFGMDDLRHWQIEFLVE